MNVSVFPSPETETIDLFVCSGYLRGTAALVIIGLIFDFFGTFISGLCLRTINPKKKQTFYRVAISVLIISSESSADQE